MDQNEYLDIYQSTGLDVDGRRDYISKMIPSIQSSVENIIEWAKTVPGFNDLPQKDQLKMIKGLYFILSLIILLFQIFNDGICNQINS